MKRLWIGFFALMTACYSTSAGVLPTGSDSFSVSADESTPAAAKQIAVAQARNYCAAIENETLITRMEPRIGIQYAFDVYFQCVSKGDPRLTDRSHESPPSTP